MNEVLQAFIQTIPVIKDAFGMDIMMSITDGNEFLAYWPGDKMVADIHVGDPLSHDDPMWTSFTTGKKLQQIFSRGIFLLDVSKCTQNFSAFLRAARCAFFYAVPEFFAGGFFVALVP